jgi:hypothetical protein
VALSSLISTGIAISTAQGVRTVEVVVVREG